MGLVGPQWPVGELETRDFSDPHSIHFSDLKAKQKLDDLGRIVAY